MINKQTYEPYGVLRIMEGQLIFIRAYLEAYLLNWYKYNLYCIVIMLLYFTFSLFFFCYFGKWQWGFLFDIKMVILILLKYL